MKLIVGLGNPGRKYAGTRHNVGFEVLSEVARRHGLGNRKEKFQAEVQEAGIDGQKIWLLCPHTYMNLSGQSVQPALEFYKLTPGDLLVICDDFNLPLAKLRFRSKGSAGGQKGLADILCRLGTDEFSRLRIGIGPVPEHFDPADFVLGKFTRQESGEMTQAVARAADAVADWVREGIDICMNRYN